MDCICRDTLQASFVVLNHGVRESLEQKSRAILLYSRTGHGFRRLLLKLEGYQKVMALISPESPPQKKNINHLHGLYDNIAIAVFSSRLPQRITHILAGPQQDT